MQNLVNATWPFWKNGICYRQDTPEDSGRIKVLEIYGAEDHCDIVIKLTEKTFSELSRPSETSRPNSLRLVIITRSWKTIGTGHKKIPQYDISQQDFTRILESQGLTNFYHQTRVDVVGRFDLPISSLQPATADSREYFGLIYDAFLGLWAGYDCENKQWQGIYIIAETNLDPQVIAAKLVDFSQNKTFLHLLAASYTVEFLGWSSGELFGQIAEIERYSGHHDLILKPVVAIYEKLELLSANATAKANLVSYYKTVVCHLADELLQYLEKIVEPGEAHGMDIKSYAAHLKRRVKSLSAYLTYLERRVERQVTATFHLVNQANASTNLTVSHDMKVLAMASKHDSSSMKILAAVTTTFLPGAFVATLFSMNMFNWFAGDGIPVASGRFWIYWSITIPLTLITVGIWVGWEFWTIKNQNKQRQDLGTEEGRLEKNMSLS